MWAARGTTSRLIGTWWFYDLMVQNSCASAVPPREIHHNFYSSATYRLPSEATFKRPPLTVLRVQNEAISFHSPALAAGGPPNKPHPYGYELK